MASGKWVHFDELYEYNNKININDKISNFYEDEEWYTKVEFTMPKENLDLIGICTCI